MSHNSRSESSSLLKQDKQGLTPATEPSDKPLSTSTRYAIKAISYMRLAAGAACLIAPQWTCASFFKYDVPSGSALLVRMVGARDGVLGELLLSAPDETAGDGGRNEIRRAIWTGIMADAIDIVSLAYTVALGQAGMSTGVSAGVGAVVSLGLAAWVLRGLR